VSVGDALDIRTEDGVVIARLIGEIDLSNARPIGSLVAGAVSNDAAGVVLDLTATTYLDSSGVHLVFDLAERLSSRQQRLALAVPDGSRIRRVLDLVNVQASVPVEVTVDAAAATVRGSPGAGSETR
jgi:anti-anti-sigma factor